MCPQAGIGFPQPLALACKGVGKGKATGIEGQRPAIIARQGRKALHRRAVDALVDDLVQREGTALPRARYFAEGDRRRGELRRVGAMPIPGHAVTTRAILREQRGAAGEVGRLARRERHGIGLEQIGGEAMGDAGDLFGRSFAAMTP
jgi:hypothetical protein